MHSKAWRLKDYILDYLQEYYDHVTFKIEESQYHGIFVLFYWDDGNLTVSSTGWHESDETIALINAVENICLREHGLRENCEIEELKLTIYY
jgi:hypothetical protein